MATNYQGRMEYHYVKLQKTGIKTSRLLTHLGRVRLGSIQIKNNWNNPSKRLFGSYSYSGIPGFSFRLFYSWEQNSWNIFQNIFLFRNIPNERALNTTQLFDEVFVISSKFKVEVRVITQSRRPRLITLTETLIILDIT